MSSVQKTIQTQFRFRPDEIFYGNTLSHVVRRFAICAALSLPGVFCPANLCGTPPALGSDATTARHLAAAQQAEQAHNYAEASREYQEILKTAPSLALIHQSLAITYHLQNLFPQAIAEFERAIRLDPTLFGSYLFLGMDLYKTNEFKRAIAPLEKSIELNRAMAEPEARFWLAATYSALDRHDDAVRELRLDLALRPKDCDVLYSLTKAYDQAAAAAFERLGRIEPLSAAVALLQGERFAEENRLDLARLQYRNAVALRPDFASWLPAEKALAEAPPELVISARDVRADLDLAELFDSAGDAHRAAAVRRGLLQRKPAEPQVAQLIALANQSVGPGADPDLAQGIDLFRQGRFQQAQSPLSKAAAHNANQALQLLLIRSYLEAGDFTLTEEKIKKILAAKPDNIDALHLLGRSYKRQAELALKQMTELAPDFYGVHELLGKQHEEKTEYQQAIDEYQAALAKRPDLAGIRYAIGNVYRKMSQYDKAQQWLQAELDRNPYHGMARYRMGSILLEQGKTSDAISQLEQALRAHPQLIEAHMDLGRAYTANGRYPEAIAQLEQVVAADPGNDRVHYLLSGAYAREGNRSRAQSELAEYQRLTRSRLENTQQDVKKAADSLKDP
ncbi:MAG TPA: tetratricopeptide repeat protein [Bryobacteraceae bacterium]|nr:tetratricopeptide repeat protein [Bryobacteraceae bacterium]